MAKARKNEPFPLAVCFDLDGVLIHTMPLHAKAWQETLRRRGIRITKREIYAWEGEPGRLTAARMLRRAGLTASRKAVRDLLDGKESRFARLAGAGRIRLLPGWLPVLRRLSARGVRLALVTGTSRHEVERVVPPAALSQFEVVVTGDQVKRGKPHPEPYRKACRLLGVAPAAAAVVENAPYGIRSGRRAGAGYVLAVASSLPAPYLREAHAVVGSIKALQRRLAQMDPHTRRTPHAAFSPIGPAGGRNGHSGAR